MPKLGRDRADIGNILFICRSCTDVGPMSETLADMPIFGRDRSEYLMFAGCPEDYMHFPTFERLL